MPVLVSVLGRVHARVPHPLHSLPVPSPSEAVPWSRYPLAAAYPPARAWLGLRADQGSDPKTIDAYARGVEYFLRFLQRPVARVTDVTDPVLSARAGSRTRDGGPTAVGPWVVHPTAVGEEHVARYVRYMRELPGPDGARVRAIASGAGLMNATMLQRITAVRLFYEYLQRKGLVAAQPAPRGVYHRRSGRGRAGVLRAEHRLPWIPSDEEWRAFLVAAAGEPLRNRVLIALSYDCALRREEAVRLEVRDITVPTRLVHVRAEIAKYARERVVPCSPASARLVVAYLPQLADELRAWAHRRVDCADGHRTRLFTSLSDRNRGRPLTLSSWNKVVTRLARPLGLPRFTPHTFRHLCLTNLARAHWDVGDIAAFAGHRKTDTTLRYLHLSGRDLLAKVARSTARLHAQSALLGELLLPA